MQRYKAIVAYDGSAYSGYQIQHNGRTVQQELEKALGKMHKTDQIKVTGSGRTDAGVHARGQTIHFDSPLRLPSERWIKALNGLLPDDISIRSVEKASEGFHARFDAKGKTYKYFVYTSAARDPFRCRYASHYPHPLDLERMRQAAVLLTGTHDFTSFCSAKTEMENKVRTVYEISIERERDGIAFTFKGNGFLYNMVRIIAGTLLDVGGWRTEPSAVMSMLEAKDRAAAGKTAPANGLFLWEVDYGEE